MYTVKQLSQLAGITARTLHYYDEIGLLAPSRVGENGYRYYGDEALLRLQQILFYRELDLPLDAIKALMRRRDYEVMDALESHREALRRRIAHMERLIETVDHTISYLKGKTKMSEKQLFEAFSDEQQAAYEKEALQLYDPAIVKASAKKWKGYSAAEKQRIGDEGQAVYAALRDAIPHGAGSAEAQAGIERWRRHMEYFWIPNDEQLLGLAEGYNTDPRFKVNFDQIDPRLAEFVREVVKIYVQRQGALKKA